MNKSDEIVIDFDLTWKDVLYPHGIIWHIDDMYNFADRIGYPYFAWNGRIYNTKFKALTDLAVYDIKTVAIVL